LCLNDPMRSQGDCTRNILVPKISLRRPRSWQEGL
jgi:hypothetical protein